MRQWSERQGILTEVDSHHWIAFLPMAMIAWVYSSMLVVLEQLLLFTG
jgi:hypothetical protein